MAVDERLEQTIVPSRAPRFTDVVPACSTVGAGSLPHRSAREAAAFSLAAFDVVTLPSLPRRSPAESHVAQALVGTPGVTLGQYGALALDVDGLDPDRPIRTDLWRDTFTGFRTTLDLAVERRHVGPIKWQFVGPISLGLALLRAGADADVAFRMAARVVRSHLGQLAAAVSAALPASPQLVVLDEPSLDGMMARDFPIAPDQAIDLISSAMAAAEHIGIAGVHCCAGGDVAGLIAAGPQVLALPANRSLVPYAGYLQSFLRRGGWVVWGAVPTGGPIGLNDARSSTALEALWRDLADRGCDPELLRGQALISSYCGLGGLGTSVAAGVTESVRTVARAVRPPTPTG